MTTFELLTKKEYERRRSNAELQEWITAIYEATEKSSSADQLLFARKKLLYKRFCEELIPVACLAQSQFADHLVYISCLVGSQNYDALVEIDGTAYKVEVTSTNDTQAAYKREMFANNGWAITGKYARAKDGTMGASHEMQDIDEECGKLAQRALDGCESYLVANIGLLRS